jgi:hypothetical protein
MIDKGKRQGSEKMTSEAEKAEDASSIVSLFYLFIYFFWNKTVSSILMEQRP